MEEVVPALGAGIVSTFICNPLDTIRINYQLNNKISYDVKNLYKGLKYGIIAVPCFWAIYFPMYKKMKDSEVSKPIAAYISCCTASTITTPFWVLRQLEQTGKKTTISFYNLYKGLIPTYIINLNFTVQVPLYEYLKDKTDNSTFNTFLNTSISKTVSAMIFYPMDSIRVKLRNSESIKKIKFTDFYRGISIYLIRSIPYHVSVFCTFEFIKNLM